MIRILHPAAIAARPHHWAKNLLVFAPIILGHRWADPSAWKGAALCFLSFSFFASFVYVLNDLFDREADRNHPRKCLRPIASGALYAHTGRLIAACFFLSRGPGRHSHYLLRPAW